MAKLYQEIIKEMQKDGHRFWAGDNVQLVHSKLYLTLY